MDHLGVVAKTDLARGVDFVGADAQVPFWRWCPGSGFVSCQPSRDRRFATTGPMRPDGVVVVHEPVDLVLKFFDALRPWASAQMLLERLVPAFDLSASLR